MGHGHVASNEDGNLARCGGPALCPICAAEKTEMRASKYWICGACADEKQWMAPEWGVTAISGLCGHCDRVDETSLVPVIDFSGPGKKAIWD